MFDILICFIVCVVGGGIAAAIVGRYVHHPLFKASDGVEDYVLEHEYKYLDELETLDRETPLSAAALKALADCTVEECTPCGRVVMTYNHDLDRFEYWSEQSHIPYKTLDTVARKFCLDNNCRSIYVDMYEELYLDALRRVTLEKATSEGSDDLDALYGSDATDIFEPDDEEHEPLLTRSHGCDLSDYATKRKCEDSDDNEPKKKNKTDGIFATFKDYNAPVKTIAPKENDEPKIKNTFMRRGTYNDWSAKNAIEPARRRHSNLSYRNYSRSIEMRPLQ